MMKADSHVFPVDSNYTWGIEVRDYIAIQIAAGLSAKLMSRNFDEIANMAYLQADALIERSNHEPDKKD